MPALSRDGSRVVYDAHDGEKVTVLESSFKAGSQLRSGRSMSVKARSSGHRKATLFSIFIASPRQRRVAEPID